MSIPNINQAHSQINQLITECESLYTNLTDDQKSKLNVIDYIIVDRFSSLYVAKEELDLIKTFLTNAQFEKQDVKQFIFDLQKATPDTYENIAFEDMHTVSGIQKHIREQAIAQLEKIKESQSKSLLHSESELETKIQELTDLSNSIHGIFESLKSHPELSSLEEKHLTYLETLNPESHDFDAKILDFSQTYSLPETQSVQDTIKQTLINAHTESKKFSRMIDDLQELFENDLSEINKHKVRNNNINNIERKLGLRIEEGNRYFYLDKAGNQQNFSIQSIKTVNTKGALKSMLQETEDLINSIQGLRGHNVESLLESDDVNSILDPISQADPSQTNALNTLRDNLQDITDLKNKVADNLDMDYIYDNYQTIITLEGDLPHGQSDSMTIESFALFLEQTNARELILTHQQMLENIEYDLYGQEIAVGTEFQVCHGFQDANQPQQHISRSVYKVTSVENDLITLVDSEDNEVQMSYPEFTKWYRQNRVEENLDLNRAREVLANQPAVLKAKYGHLAGDDYFTDNPIRIEEGEVLHARDGSYFTIETIEDSPEGQMITLDTDRIMSIPEFVEFCKDYELQSFGLANPQEMPNGEKAKPAKEKAKQKGMNPFKYLPLVKNVFFDPLSLLELELMNFNDYAQLASMATDIYKKHVERNDKERLNRIGKTLPGELGRRFADEESSIIGEKIKAESDRIASDTVFDVNEKLKKAPDRYKARAHMDFLADKGMLNLEDPDLHKTLNRLLKKHKDVVLGNTNKKPQDFKINEFGFSKSGQTAKTATKAALDALYGKGTGDEIANKQDRSYTSEVENYKKVISEEFFKIGGLGPEMHKILHDFVKGNDVHPAQFEGYLTAGIEKAFLEGDDAMFFIIAGMAAKSPNGTTLLSDSYINRMQRGAVPQIDYLARLKDEKSGRKLQGLCPEILEFLEYNPKKKPPYNKDRLTEYVRLEASSTSKTKARVDSSRTFDKEYTGHAFPSARPESLYTKLGVNRQLTEIQFGQEQIDNSFEGFITTLNVISKYESGDSDIGQISSVKYSNLNEADRAKNLAEVLGSWYVLFSNINPYTSDAYTHPSPIKDYAYTKSSQLEPVKAFMSDLIESFPNEIPFQHARYLLGERPLPKDRNESHQFVSQFYKKIREIAAAHPTKFLSIIKGAKFTKKEYTPGIQGDYNLRMAV